MLVGVKVFTLGIPMKQSYPEANEANLRIFQSFPGDFGAWRSLVATHALDPRRILDNINRSQHLKKTAAAHSAIKHALSNLAMGRYSPSIMGNSNQQ